MICTAFSLKTKVITGLYPTKTCNDLHAGLEQELGRVGARVPHAEAGGGELREAEEAPLLPRGADQGQQEGQEGGRQGQGSRQGRLRLKQ